MATVSNPGSEDWGSWMTLYGVPSARRAVRGAADSLAELTPGQRWTVSLMLGLAVIVLALGLPTATRLVLPATPSSAAEAPGDGETQAVPTAGAPSLLTAPIVAPVADSPGRTVGAPQPAIEATDTSGPIPASAVLKVVAFVDPAVGVGDRTDEAMARRFLATAGVSAVIVPISDAAATCAAAGDADLVISGGSLPAELVSCLHGAGATTLSFDDSAPLGPDAVAVSSRRGVARSLFDTADRARSKLTGKLGLVADERFKALLEPLLPAARSKGLDISTITWLGPGSPPASVALDLAGAGVSGVLFATTTQNQSTIGSQLRTLSPSAKLAVLDAADSVTLAFYPPVFDGAIAVTSVQLPWHPGAVPQRAACRATWEAAQTPPVIVDGAELLRALTWCQHAAMADAAARRLDRGVLRAVTGQMVASPITSRLAALPDGGFGPTLITEATWSAQCACWTSSAAFTEGSRS